MRISELPEPIRQLALKRQKECKVETYYKNTDTLIDAFDWSETVEGDEFWEIIEDNNFAPFYELYPQKDKLDELIEWMESEINKDKKDFSDKSCGIYYGIFKCITKAKELKQQP